MDILSTTGQVLFSAPAKTIKELVEAAVKAKANLSYANLNSADLSYANLSSANLSWANLNYATLNSADLSSANLNYATLNSADLSSANLSWANLRWANLRYAKNIPAIIAAQLLVPPEEGPFIGWKKCKDDVIVKLLIPRRAKRSSATSRKCRASEAIVLQVIGAEIGLSMHDCMTTYSKKAVVKPDSFDEDRWNECSNGIHFFITRAEAEAYAG
jgi:hypothetical protein